MYCYDAVKQMNLKPGHLKDLLDETLRLAPADAGAAALDDAEPVLVAGGTPLPACCARASSRTPHTCQPASRPSSRSASRSASHPAGQRSELGAAANH